MANIKGDHGLFKKLRVYLDLAAQVAGALEMTIRKVWWEGDLAELAAQATCTPVDNQSQGLQVLMPDDVLCP